MAVRVRVWLRVRVRCGCEGVAEGVRVWLRVRGCG